MPQQRNGAVEEHRGAGGREQAVDGDPAGRQRRGHVVRLRHVGQQRREPDDILPPGLLRRDVLGGSHAQREGVGQSRCGEAPVGGWMVRLAMVTDHQAPQPVAVQD